MKIDISYRGGNLLGTTRSAKGMRVECFASIPFGECNPVKLIANLILAYSVLLGMIDEVYRRESDLTDRNLFIAYLAGINTRKYVYMNTFDVHCVARSRTDQDCILALTIKAVLQLRICFASVELGQFVVVCLLLITTRKLSCLCSKATCHGGMWVSGRSSDIASTIRVSALRHCDLGKCRVGKGECSGL
jgi:hypothetical protein